MKTCHDFDSTMVEGSLVVIHERYNIPGEYALHASLPGQRPYSLGSPRLSISVDALEARLHFPLHPTIEECLGWWRISLSQGGSRAHSKGKKLAVSGGKPTPPAFHHPKSMKELCGKMVCKNDEGYYALHMINLPPRDLDSEIRARWEALKNSTEV
ncbi:hypothetical protein GW17_00032208 [Ensete ventricosum]|uniref:Uncharacterized protein n=1 Tax=Ensete ventricosum TaxID=4639 RepID=A0A426XLR1_ENSVE|nr:hypothetical protein B296_00057797 [Ensete ventricosum]RWW04559.1 hypothetical protein GW17_00032208 [Ensete ventricosum]